MGPETEKRELAEKERARDEAVVYTETVVFAPPEQYAADAPYRCSCRSTVRRAHYRPDFGQNTVGASLDRRSCHFRE